MSDDPFHQPAGVSRYLQSLAQAPADDCSLDDVRFVSLDCETTGTDAKRDRIITMGAIAVQDAEIRLDDQFEAMLHVSHNTSSVLVHGITAEQAAEAGVTEAEALAEFLDYLRNAVIVGHHIGFDVEVIQHACQRNFGIDLKNRWIDTMEVTLHLDDLGVFDDLAKAAGISSPPFRNFSLDGLCEQFHVNPHDRHTASGDAFITAQIFLKLLRLARRQGRTTLGALAERYVDPRASE
ncbi:MAG: 3'-5' exonuclease [Synoicihabitans sp.]